MKGLLLTLTGIVIVATLGFAYSSGVDYFTARADGDGITIEWKSGVENGISSYTLERSAIGTNDFEDVANIPATGSYSYYKYYDSRIGAAPVAGQNSGYRPLAEMYRYRLRLNLANAVSYSTSISVTKPSSGVRRTWGMIKEMFH